MQFTRENILESEDASDLMPDELLNESDKEYYVVDKNNPHSKPHWVKTFDSNKHFLWQPDWPIQGSSIRDIRKPNVQPKPQNKQVVKDLEEANRILKELCKARTKVRQQGKSDVDLTKKIAQQYKVIDRLKEKL